MHTPKPFICHAVPKSFGAVSPDPLKDININISIYRTLVSNIFKKLKVTAGQEFRLT